MIVKKMKHIDDDWNFTGAINENLGSYWTCIQGMDQKRWFTQEIYNQKKLHFKKLSEKSVLSLGLSQRQGKYFSANYSYDILC